MIVPLRCFCDFSNERPNSILRATWLFSESLAAEQNVDCIAVLFVPSVTSDITALWKTFIHEFTCLDNLLKNSYNQ